jgi:hypothetical protein
MPLSVGSFARRVRNASSPPADALIPTTRKSTSCFAPRALLAHALRGPGRIGCRCITRHNGQPSKTCHAQSPTPRLRYQTLSNVEADILAKEANCLMVVARTNARVSRAPAAAPPSVSSTLSWRRAPGRQILTHDRNVLFSQRADCVASNGVNQHAGRPTGGNHSGKLRHRIARRRIGNSKERPLPLCRRAKKRTLMLVAPTVRRSV